MSIKKKIKAKWMFIVAVFLIIGIAAASKVAGGVEAEVLSILKGEMRQGIEDTAEVLSPDRQTVYIEGTGKVVKISVDVGDSVKQGEVLLSLDKTDLELQLKDAEAKIAAAKAQLQGAELINYANKIELAKAAAEQAQVTFASAQRNYENAQSLYESQAISKGELEKALEDYQKAEASLAAANLQLADLSQGTPDYVKSGYRAQLEQAVIYRDTILRNLQKQEIRAELEGVILEKLIEKNSLAVPGTAAFVIGTADYLELEANILADEINEIKIGNPVEISGKTVGDRVLQGKVVKIAPVAKTIASNLGINQKRVPVAIAITGGIGPLKPGYNVDVKIITAVKDNIITVPDSAVFEYQGKSQVFVMEQGKAVLREVKKGIESGDFIEIQEGLQEGENILAKPGNTIKEGAKIKPLMTK